MFLQGEDKIFVRISATVVYQEQLIEAYVKELDGLKKEIEELHMQLEEYEAKEEKETGNGLESSEIPRDFTKADKQPLSKEE